MSINERRDRPPTVQVSAVTRDLARYKGTRRLPLRMSLSCDGVVVDLRGVARLADTRSNHQGRYGEAYFHVLATAAGVVANKVEYDIEGVDFFVSLPRAVRGVRFPKIEVQVKSESAPKRSADSTVWKYTGLDEPRFNNLAGAGFSTPRFLVLVTVPEEPSAYTQATAHALRLNHAAYWVSLEDRLEIPDPNPSRRVRVEIPTANLLTVESLLALFEWRPADVSTPTSSSKGRHD
jgi:Domain of unknown function (DUF4365)